MRFGLRPGIARLLRMPRMSAHADADAELESVIASRVEYLIARGMSRAGAREEALRRIGASIDDARAQLHESAHHREQHMQLRERVSSFAQDVRYAARGLASRPTFTLVAVLTLAIGIGATTAIFSAVNVLLLRPLPYARPDQLMKVTLVTPGRGNIPANDQMVWSFPKSQVFRKAQHVFSDIALYTSGQFTVRAGEAERVTGEEVGATYFPLLGLSASRGRVFDRSLDAHPNAERQVILSYSFWERRFNADPSIVGRTIDIDHQPYTAVGIGPRDFAGLSGQADVFLPLMARPADEFTQPQMHEFWMVARRVPGVSAEQALAAVRVLGKQVNDAIPDSYSKNPWGATTEPLDNARLAPSVRRSLLVLFGAVAFVLLIACVNVANLLLGRANTRAREIAVRLAIGASRGRLVRLLLIESLLLAFVGAGASLVVAWGGVRLLGTIDPATTLRVTRDSGLGAVAFSAISLDWTALAFTLGVTLVVGLVFGLVPAIGATRASLMDALKDGRSKSARAQRGSLRRALVVVEVALAIVLLAGSGLMIRSLSKLLAVDPGFDGTNVLTMSMSIPVEGNARDSMPGFYEQLLDRVRAVPGVTDASMTNCAPLAGRCNSTIIWFDGHVPDNPAHAPTIGLHWVSPTWFATVKVPLRRGRVFTNVDRSGAPVVAVINDVAAKKFWPGEDPIGKHIGAGMGGMEDAEVIGVVGSVRLKADSAPTPDVYISYLQFPHGGTILFVRAARNPTAIAAAVRHAIHEVAPQYPIFNVKTMAERAAAATAPSRFSAALLGLFALTALSLASIGIYGVMALAVSARTREIGVRIALGADRGRVQRLVVGEGVALVAVGAAFGIAGALVATRVLRSLLFDLTPADPPTYVAIVALLAASALFASWLPARRASRVDPVTALRAD
ncbi:MAG: ADOP family duplicated permease [Gemmatimonadaceae bacterium]